MAFLDFSQDELGDPLSEEEKVGAARLWGPCSCTDLLLPEAPLGLACYSLSSSQMKFCSSRIHLSHEPAWVSFPEPTAALAVLTPGAQRGCWAPIRPASCADAALGQPSGQERPPLLALMSPRPRAVHATPLQAGLLRLASP